MLLLPAQGMAGNFDMVVCLLGTLSHMLDNKQAAACFRKVAQHLRPGGLFVLELAHPGALGAVASNTTVSPCDMSCCLLWCWLVMPCSLVTDHAIIAPYSMVCCCRQCSIPSSGPAAVVPHG
jgi:SAM-dependent methyltransferase